jgi:hypothetical protein
MTLEQYRIVSEIAYNVVVSFGLLGGGIWTYFRYVKGRLREPRGEISRSHQVIPLPDGRRLVAFEFQCKNVGDARIDAKSVQVECEGIRVVESSTETELISGPKDLLRFSTEETPGGYYVDPGETTIRSTDFLVGEEFVAVKIRLRAEYHDRVAEQTYYVSLVNSATNDS